MQRDTLAESPAVAQRGKLRRYDGASLRLSVGGVDVGLDDMIPVERAPWVPINVTMTMTMTAHQHWNCDHHTVMQFAILGRVAVCGNCGAQFYPPVPPLSDGSDRDPARVNTLLPRDYVERLEARERALLVDRIDGETERDPDPGRAP